jgi:hypothetical protein
LKDAKAFSGFYLKEGHTPATFTGRSKPMPRVSTAIPMFWPVAWFKDPAGNILSPVERGE